MSETRSYLLNVFSEYDKETHEIVCCKACLDLSKELIAQLEDLHIDSIAELNSTHICSICQKIVVFRQ